MPPSRSPSDSPPPPAYALLEWLLIAGLMTSVAWTTLCLGGFLAETMIVTGTAVLSLGALGALLWMIGQGAGPRSLNIAVLLPVPFLLYALGSVLWQAPAVWLAWREWLLWFQMWIVFALILHFGRTRRHTWTVVATIVALAFAGVVMAAYQRFSDPHWLMLGRKQAAQFNGRSSGMFGIPNSLAGWLEVLVPVCLCLVSSRAVKPVAKIMCCWFAVLFLAGMVLTGSRGGWLGLGLALMTWPLLAGRTLKRKAIGTLVVFGCVFSALGVVYHGSEYARERMQPFLDGEFELSRPIVWKAGREIWQEHPWFGTGAASYNVVFEQYRPQGFQDEPVWAHNEYLNTLSDYGLAGFVLWLGAGMGLLILGLLAFRRARRDRTSAHYAFGLAKWRLGLVLGLLAYAIHLCLDFHTRIPALAFLAAIVAGLLLRDEPGLRRPVPSLVSWGGGALLILVSMGTLWRIALPLYRSEALRFEARLSIDRYARTLKGDLPAILSAARPKLASAVQLNPNNAQAWSDLAYVNLLDSRRGNSVAQGRFAELAADEALQRCSIRAEFWVNKGKALDLQRGRDGEADACFRRAVELAPKSAPTWYAYAFHLQAFPNRRDEARKAIETCLTLDPYSGAADILRRQLASP